MLLMAILNVFSVFNHNLFFLFRNFEKLTQAQECHTTRRGNHCDDFREGCFCPEGTVLFSQEDDTCVSACKSSFCYEVGPLFGN